MHTKSLSSIVDTAQPYLAAVIGNIICGLGINAFFIPHHLLSSGLSGIAIIIYYAVGFPVGTVVFILNIPIMLACYKYMGRKYTLISLIGTVLFSALNTVMLLQQIPVEPLKGIKLTFVWKRLKNVITLAGKM